MAEDAPKRAWSRPRRVPRRFDRTAAIVVKETRELLRDPVYLGLSFIIPLVITAFTITRPESLPPPTFPAAFDEVGATQSARELATQFPNRTPGSPTAKEAADWVAERLASFGFRVQRDRFQSDVPGEGQVGLENVIAVSPGRSPDVLVVMAHRDNLGTTGQGANDNASGTGVLLELARGYGLRAAPAPGQERTPAGPTHTIVLVSSDGGAYGGAHRR